MKAMQRRAVHSNSTMTRWLRAPCHALLLVALGVTLGVAHFDAWAQADAAQRLQQRALAANCAHCHGTDGRAVEGESTARLAGVPREQLRRQLLDFRSGARPSTVMQQIARGYTDAQIESLAAYFASVR